MVAIYKNPSATLREWAHPYRASHPDFVQGLEDVADSVEAIEAKVADLDAFDLDEVVSAATELQAVDDTLPQTVWRDDHTTHVKDLVELAQAFDAFATELGEPAYATHDPAERRKLMILAARRSRAFADVLDVVLVGGEGDEPDFKGFETAIRDWEPKAEAWQKWVKTYVAGLVEYREANKANRKTVGDLIKNNSEFQTENTRLGNEVIALRAELDVSPKLLTTLDAAAAETWGAEWSEMRPEERLRTITQTFRRSQAFCNLLDDALIVGEVDSDPDLKGFYTAIDDAAAWKTWRKQLVDDVIQNQKATRARSAEFEAMVQTLTVDNVHKDLEIQRLRAELDALKATPSGHNADLQDQTIKASTKLNQYAYTIEQVRGVAGKLTSILSDLDKTRVGV